MLVFIVIVFLVIFAAVALTMTLGEQYFQDQKKKKVSEMLQTVGGETQTVEAKVLLSPEGQQSSALVQFLSRFDFVKKIETDIQQSGMNITLNALIMQMFIASIPGAILGSRFSGPLGPIPGALIGGFVLAMLPHSVVRRAKNKRMHQFEEQFPEALDFLSRAMRAGHAFSISMEMLAEESPAPLSVEFKKVFNESNLGLPIETALQNLSRRIPLIDVAFFVSAVLLQRETGGNLAEILTKLATIIRERFKLKGAVRAASAHGRITGTILTLMPVALLLGLMVIAPTYLGAMAADPDGKWIMVGAACGILAGHFFIRKIVNIKV